MRVSGEFSAQHPALAGHFPGNPIVPGVLIVSRVCSAVACAHGGAVAAVPAVKFHAPLRPCESFDIDVEPAGAGRYRFKVARGDTLIATGIVHAAGA